jgi:hypothetical protein
MTPAPYPKPSHGSVICTAWDCPDREESKALPGFIWCKGRHDRILIPISCENICSANWCPRGFTR